MAGQKWLALDVGKSLSKDYGLKDGSVIVFKDLGPQAGPRVTLYPPSPSPLSRHQLPAVTAVVVSLKPQLIPSIHFMIELGLFTRYLRGDNMLCRVKLSCRDREQSWHGGEWCDGPVPRCPTRSCSSPSTRARC